MVNPVLLNCRQGIKWSSIIHELKFQGLTSFKLLLKFLFVIDDRTYTEGGDISEYCLKISLSSNYSLPTDFCEPAGIYLNDENTKRFVSWKLTCMDPQLLSLMNIILNFHA